METKNTVKFKDIETPTTVEGFRENLMKYYVCHGRKLVVKGDLVSVDDLECLDDLYKITPQPMITPLVYYDRDDVRKHMMKPNHFLSFEGLFEEDEFATIYENQQDFINSGIPFWVKIDSQILREFFWKTLGDFSGYSYNIHTQQKE